MTPGAALTRQQLVTIWVAQMVGTIVVAGAVLAFVKQGSVALGTIPEDLRGYTLFAILAAGTPALLYLRHYKSVLDQDLRLERQRGGNPEPGARNLLRKAMTLGGALCEIPMVLGLVQLFMGGESKWFLGATMIAIALRLSYRPFGKSSS